MDEGLPSHLVTGAGGRLRLRVGVRLDERTRNANVGLVDIAKVAVNVVVVGLGGPAAKDLMVCSVIPCREAVVELMGGFARWGGVVKFPNLRYNDFVSRTRPRHDLMLR